MKFTKNDYQRLVTSSLLLLLVGWPEGHPTCTKFWSNNSQKLTYELSLLPFAGWEIWVVAYKLRGEGLVWLIGAVVCLRAALRVQSFASAGSRWPHNAPRYHYLMPIGCHFCGCKALLVVSLTHASSAIVSTRPLPLPSRDTAEPEVTLGNLAWPNLDYLWENLDD